MAEANQFLGLGRWCRIDPALAAALDPAEADRPSSLGDRAEGTVVTDHRSSWVRAVHIGTTPCHVKVYDYPGHRDRWRGIGRTTAFARSRAAREWDALVWLRAQGFAAPRPLGVAEWRRGPLLRRALLVTETWPGRDLTVLLPELDPPARQQLLSAVAAFVDRLHAAGFCDRNLDPRNLLARRVDRGGFEIAKLDSPRHVLVPPGRRRRRLARQDQERLQRGLAAFTA